MRFLGFYRLISVLVQLSRTYILFLLNNYMRYVSDYCFSRFTGLFGFTHYSVRLLYQLPERHCSSDSFMFHIQNIVLFAINSNSTLFLYDLISILVLIYFSQSLAIRFRITSFEEQFTLPFYSITNANNEMYVYKFLSSSVNDSCLFISINVILWLIFTWMKLYYASISNYYYPYCVVILSASVTI